MPKSDVIELAFELSQQRLNSQMTSALAADARATGYAGVMIAAAAILTGLSTTANAPAFMIAGASLLIFSAALAGYAARPVQFFMPGAKFSDLAEDIQEKKEKEAVLMELGGFMDENSAANDRIMRRNSKTMRIALFVAVIGIIVATAPQIARFTGSTAPESTTPAG